MSNFAKSRTILEEGPAINVDKADVDVLIPPLAWVGSGVSGYSKETKKFMDLFFRYVKYVQNPANVFIPRKDLELIVGLIVYIGNVNNAYAKGQYQKRFKEVGFKYAKLLGQDK